jgi:hypothetical protein
MMPEIPAFLQAVFQALRKSPLALFVKDKRAICPALFASSLGRLEKLTA